MLTGNTQPFFTSIDEFRRVRWEAFGALFVEVLKPCRRAGLVRLRHVAIDGTKVKANASKHKAMSDQRMVREERRLRAEVECLLGEAEAADASEDARYGQGMQGDELPAELGRRESRLARIRAAKAELEAEARQSRARALRAGPRDRAHRRVERFAASAHQRREAPCQCRAVRLDTPEGRALYVRPKAVVELVNGPIKHARRLRQFWLRGLAAVDAEWTPVSLCHNLLELFAQRPERVCPS